MRDKISVIVPVFNLENEIERTVRSILNQTYDNLEIILVDDGSTDNSGERIDSIACEDQRIKTIHKENGGVSSARLTGVMASTGEWIGFVDGDDYIEPNMYGHLLKNALTYKADISHCGYQMVFPNRIDMYYNTGVLKLQDKGAGLLDLIEGKYVEPGVWNKLFHRTLFDSVLDDNVIDLSIKNNEDLLMNYYLFKNAKCSVYEDFCPYHYIIRENSAAMSQQSLKKLKDPLEVMKIIVKETTNDELLNRVARERLGLMLIKIATMDIVHYDNAISEYVSECRENLKDNRKEIINSASRISFLIKYHLSVLSPGLYRHIHKIYSRLKKTDRKYNYQ